MYLIVQSTNLEKQFQTSEIVIEYLMSIVSSLYLTLNYTTHLAHQTVTMLLPDILLVRNTMGVYNGVNSFFKKNSYFCTHGFLPMTRNKSQKMYKENTLNKNTFSEFFYLIVHCSTRLQSMSIFSGEGT